MAEKTEKKSGGGQIIKLALVLFAVSAIMALALGLVNELTKDTIAMRAAETTKNAYANVLAADEYTEQADFENDGTITKLGKKQMVTAMDQRVFNLPRQVLPVD